jgi:hypothetical protein
MVEMEELALAVAVVEQVRLVLLEQTLEVQTTTVEMAVMELHLPFLVHR